MPTELVNKNSTYLTRYDAAPDPYLAFANESGPGIQGSLLACRKGDWGIGPDASPVKAGTRFLLIVTETMRGWLCWRDGTVVNADMAFVRDNVPMKHRYALGDEDPEQWEKNPDGTPRDPWSPSYRTLLIELSPPHGDFTFSSSAWGGQLALKEICKVYAAEAPLHDGAFPVVELTTRTRQNKNYGAIKGPWFDVVGWATVEDVRAGRKVGAALKKTEAAPKAKARAKTKPTTAEVISDELPDW
jgi:hypothetical protein